MASGGVILGRFDGTPRLRVARPGFDVTDPGLVDQQLAFDSAWPEILTVLDANWNLLGTISTEAWTYNGATINRYYRTVSFATLPWEPICIGWHRAVNGSGQVWYQQTVCSSHVDHCTFRTLNFAHSTTGTAYIIFANPLTAADTREADLDGSHGVLLGNHPTRGPGLYVSRKGADVLTCADADLRFSTAAQIFQMAETGAVWGTPVTGSGTSAISVTITLQGSYPNFPPVLLLGGSDTAGVWSAQITWLSASSFSVLMTTSVAQAIQYIIPAYDPTYAGGADTVATPRVRLDADDGLKISKRNVNVNTAAASQLLLDTSKSVLHVQQRVAHDAITAFTGTQSTDLTGNTAGPPLGFYAGYRYGRWWCAGGALHTAEGPIGNVVGLPLPDPWGTEMAAWSGADRKAWSIWGSGHSTTSFRAAIVDHSATYAGEDDLYSGAATAETSTYTDFGTATVGSAPAGWTTRQELHSAGGAASTLRVDTVADATSGKAVRAYNSTSPTVNELQSTFDAAGVIGDCDILVGFKMVNGPDTYPLQVMFKWGSTTDFQVGGVRCDVSGGVAQNSRIYYGYDNWTDILIAGGTIGSATHNVGSYGVRLYPWAYDTWYWLRMNLQAGYRRLKVWPRGSAEPQGWTLAFAGPGVTTGRVGFHMPGTPTAKTYVDFYSVCASGRPAYGPV
ncbi:hypothetical protein [Xanthobacter autotrophicus]|uniref:hypothetical protein n=1 Tax=Xanthobacter autotrophicus TaxID=280 RepID=UPI0037281EE5